MLTCAQIAEKFQIDVDIERAIQTLKHEALNAFLVVSQRHLNYIAREFQAWYNHERGHSGVLRGQDICERELAFLKKLTLEKVDLLTKPTLV